MLFETFAEKMKEDVQSRLEGYAEVSLVCFLHNNSREIQSLCVRAPGTAAAPAVPLQPFYEKYQSGTEWSTLVLELVKVIRAQIGWSFPMDRVTDWDRAREYIRPMLVNRERNQRRRELCPHRDFLDLTVLYYIKWTLEGFGDAIAVIQNDHMEKWGVEEADLHEVSTRNVRMQDAPSCMTFEELAGDMCPEEEEETGEEGAHESCSPLMIATTSSRRYGAVLMALEDWLRELCARRDWDKLYILPSCVHEILLLPVDEAVDPAYLKDLIHQVNEEMIHEEEWLSDSLYLYDAGLNQVSVWS